MKTHMSCPIVDTVGAWVPHGRFVIEPSASGTAPRGGRVAGACRQRPRADGTGGATSSNPECLTPLNVWPENAERLAPGTKLPEAPLCELFGVSRAVVRKAL